MLSGKVKVTVGGQSHQLGPGMALRFKALREHHFDIIEDAEFLLIHYPGLEGVFIKDFLSAHGLRNNFEIFRWDLKVSEPKCGTPLSFVSYEG